jgi:hypothetical protein
MMFSLGETSLQKPKKSRQVICKYYASSLTHQNFVTLAAPDRQLHSSRFAGPDLVLPPSGRRPDPKKKQFCSYWLRTGECDFIQQGCMYKHEIPSNLDSVGLNKIPEWIQKKQRLTYTSGPPSKEAIDDLLGDLNEPLPPIPKPGNGSFPSPTAPSGRNISAPAADGFIHYFQHKHEPVAKSGKAVAESSLRQVHAHLGLSNHALNDPFTGLPTERSDLAKPRPSYFRQQVQEATTPRSGWVFPPSTQSVERPVAEQAPRTSPQMLFQSAASISKRKSKGGCKSSGKNAH